MSPSILERITHRPPRPPTRYDLDVQARFDAMKVAYQAMRNREPKRRDNVRVLGKRGAGR